MNLLLTLLLLISMSVFAVPDISFLNAGIDKMLFEGSEVEKVRFNSKTIFESSSEPEIIYSAASDFNFTTNISLGEITITGYKGTGGQVNIPPEINTFPVKKFATSAFSSKSTITGMTVPNSVTNIGATCFYNCTSLTNVILSSNLETIGNSIFHYCSKLERVDYPDGLITIPENFDGCAKLGEITYGSKVKGIILNTGANWVYCTSLSNITVSSSNPYYSSYDGVLFNSNKTDIIICGRGKSGVFDMPSTVTQVLHHCFYLTQLSTMNFSENLMKIGEGAFYGSNLKYAILPDSLTDVFAGAFAQSISITNVVIGSGLKNILSSTFSGNSSLRYLTLPDVVTNIDYQAFNSCTITNFTLPSSLVNIGGSAFYGNKFTEILIPDSVKSIGPSAFATCANLTNIVIGAGVVSIFPDSVFAACNKLANIDVSTENSIYASHDGYILSKDLTSAVYYPLGREASVVFPEGMKNILSYFARNNFKIRGVDFPSTLTNIEERAFENSAYITNIVFKEGLVSIGTSAFYNNDPKVIQMPDSLIYLGDTVFQTCDSITNIVIGKNVTRLGDGCLQSCIALKTVNVPDNIKSIGASCFANCLTLTNIIIGSGVTNIASYNFITSSGSLTNITVSADNTKYSSADGILYDKLMENLFVCPPSKGPLVTIPEGVTNIQTYAFRGNVAKRIIFPSSIKSIEAYAFWMNPDGYYFAGNAPTVASAVFSGGTIYHLESATGWPVVPAAFSGKPTAIWANYPNVP